FKGEIDEVRVWNIVRSPEQIQGNFDRELTGNESGLVGYWNFNPESVNSNVVDDLSGNSNNGTVVTNGTPVDPFVSSVDPSATFYIKDSLAYQAGIAFTDSFGDEINNANQLYPDSQGNSSFKVKLTSQPTGNVTLALATASGSLDQTSLTFTTNNWDSYQTVNVSGLGSIANSFDITSTATSSDSNYDNLSSTLGVLTAAPSNLTKINVTEGGTVQPDPVITANITPKDAQEGQTEPGTFTISLSAPAPQGGLTIPYTISGTAVEGTDYVIKSDQTLGLNGINDYVRIGNESNFDLTNAITVETWIKVDSFTKQWQAIVTKGDSSWRLHRYQETNKLNFAIGAGGLNNVTSNQEVNDGQWHHIAGVYDGSKIQLYIDGVLDTEVAHTGSIPSNNYEVFIGANAQQA
ncbi:MAG: LamG domain-containing protein, partial [Cyanobacteria bacterium J06638_38]